MLNGFPVVLTIVKATTNVTPSTSINVDSTITFSLILALCALFAPSITAMINNLYHYFTRKLELRHDEYLHYSEILYQKKYTVYSSFIEIANKYTAHEAWSKKPTELLSIIHQILILCDTNTATLVLEFKEFVFDKGFSAISPYRELITAISQSFNRELSMLSRTQDRQRE